MVSGRRLPIPNYQPPTTNHQLRPRVDQPQRASFDVNGGAVGSTAFGREVFERPAVVDERLLNGRLMKRGVHGFTESRLVVTIARSVNANGGPVNDDANRFGAAYEEPGFGVGLNGQATYSIGSTTPF